MDQGRLGPLMKRLLTSQWEGLLRKSISQRRHLLCRPRALRRPGGMHNGEVARKTKTCQVQYNQIPNQTLLLTSEETSNSKLPPVTLPEIMTTNTTAIWWQQPQIRKPVRNDLLKRKLDGKVSTGGRESEWPKPALVQK